MKRLTINDRQIEDYNKEIRAIHNFKLWVMSRDNSTISLIEAADMYINHVKALKQRACIINREESR